MAIFKRSDKTPSKRYSIDETPFRRNDRAFIAQVDNLRTMKEFLIQTGVKLSDKDRDVLAMNSYLNTLKFKLESADPTNDDWRNLDTARFTLSPYLTGDLLTRFQLRLAPDFLYYLPVMFSFVIVLCLSVMYLPPNYSVGQLLGFIPPVGVDEIMRSWFLVGSIGWAIGLGGLGAIVFLYVSALSIEIDRTVDVSDKGFVLMRIIVGCLFGFVLGLPTILSEAGDKPIMWVQAIRSIQDATVLISPFVYGFSTPLVIAVLNRMIETIQGFLGMQSKKPAAAPLATRQLSRSTETNEANG